VRVIGAAELNVSLLSAAVYRLAAGRQSSAQTGGAAPALATDEGTTAVGRCGVNDVNSRNETPLHGAMYRDGSIELIDFLVEHEANLEGVVNSRGWTPPCIADGIALDGSAFIRYPDTAAHLRELMQAQGLPVPPVEWDGPGGKATAE
jgi:hypothetical protein